MSARLYATVYAGNDLPTSDAEVTSKSLGTVNEATELECRPMLHGTGSGRIKISRYHTQAALLQQDRYLLVHSDAGIIGGFFLDEGTIGLSADGNASKGGEFMEWTGQGPMAKLRDGNMDADSNITGGHNPIDGYWDLDNQGPAAGDSNAHPIPMMKRVLVEMGLNSPNGIAIVDHSSWTYDTDSAGASVPFLDGEAQGAQVGDTGLDLIARMDQLGGVVFVMSPLFKLDAYLSFGTDRSGAFATDTVRFEKGVNIAAAVQRKVRGAVNRTHLIVEGQDRTYVTVVDPDYVAGDIVRWGYFSVPETSNTDQLTAAGLAHIEQRKRQTDSWTFPQHDHGDDPANEIYEPAPDIADGHYWLGDSVTLHTGTGAYDANEETVPIAAITFQLKTGSEGNGDYWVIPEVGSTFMWSGDQASFTSNITPAPPSTIRLCAPAQPAVSGGNYLTECWDGISDPLPDGQTKVFLRTNAASSACDLIDGDDVTNAQTAAPVAWAGAWAAVYQNVDLAVAALRFRQANPLSGGAGSNETATSWVLEYSDDWDQVGDVDGGTWTVAYTGDATLDTGVVSLGSTITARYWRVRALAGGGGGWVINTLELYGPSTVANNPLNGTANCAKRGDALTADTDIRTDETDTSLVLHPDGTGGVKWSAGGSYSDEQTQDAVGAMLADTATIDFTYTDATPELKADVKPGGIKLDDLGAPDDNTDLNASTSKHGLLPKLPGGTSTFLRGDGTFATPPAGGSLALDDLTDVDAAAPSDGDVLTFDSAASEWVPAAPSGGGGGSSGWTKVINADPMSTLANWTVRAGTWTPGGTYGLNSTGNGGDDFIECTADLGAYSFRAIRATVRLTNGGKLGVGFSDSGGWGGGDEAIALDDSNDDVWWDRNGSGGSTVNFTVAQNTDYLLFVIERSAGTYDVYIDGVFVTRISLPAGNSGRVGLYCRNGTGWFRDVTVWGWGTGIPT